MARYRIPGKNYSRRSIFGITAIVVVVAALVAAGVAVAVLSVLREIETGPALSMLGIGLACLALAQLTKEEKDG